ncbi:MAG: branched-chain amino acid transport system permease protein [Pseudonocardiales bacterium]|nr:branched-chain amino acid transport system permease protein [Pseudonocardiales bacterium]MDT7568480.1 branched-chain amino acid transport system permease protein [Pseudonocardiales bacterium]MDT7584744.1 branched-chain amino acid transport system permease protein [Pseudonocardiales bacterium]MDT7593175.1 branched-chain amino acid transport system permease protein [Pseudonocardiales bacterium]MDT7627456.1 branched-chain amino acid transport system permease protein [Pseudonocardiales bacterium
MLNDFIQQFGPSTVGGLVAGSIYALVALGYTMVYGVLRLINFAHSEIFMIGTFATLFVLSLIGLPGPLTGLALVGMIVLLIVAAMAASGGAAVLLEILAYRPLRKRNAPRLAALISAIGASVFLQELFALVVIPDVFNKPGRIDTAVPRLVDRDTVFTVFGADIKTDQLVIFIAAVVMMVALDQLVARTRIGRGIRATAQDPEAAVLMGVNIDTIVRLTFLLGGAMAGVAGVLYAMEFENISYKIGFVLGIKAFTAAVLGGIGNIRGALIGGVALGLVENWGAIFFGSQWKDVIAFVILVVVLLFRPTGILGESLQQARA